MLFDANEFLKSVAHVKTFWLSSKLNNLRIEAHKNTHRIDFISINRETGLETVVSVPAYVSEDIILYSKTVIAFYRAVEILQEMNVGKKNPLKLRLIPNLKNKEHYSLEVSLTHLNIVVSTKKL